MRATVDTLPTSAAYRRLALTILRLDVATLANELVTARRAPSADVPTGRIWPDRRMGRRSVLSVEEVRSPTRLVA